MFLNKMYIILRLIKSIEDKIPNITNLATNTTLSTKTNEVEYEITITTNVATTTALNIKISEVKKKIPSITYLTTTAVENKILDISNLVKKTKYNTTGNEIERKLLLMMIMTNILLLKNLIS